MITVITYDIADPHRLSRLCRFLKEYGIRSQRSVFECRLSRDELETIRKYCKTRLDLEEDSVRIYRICDRCMTRAFVQGQGIKLTITGWDII